ncbi:MAG TPA: acetylornithine deacetylase [Thioalkalivibrio sp.]|nr:acetylornithine deacetylase [Thioalkalivibrio sp.]
MTDKFPSLEQMIAELVAEPSVSSVSPEFDMGNRGVIERLSGWLEDLGFRVEVVPVADSPFKANLIATLGEGEDGLVLAGHTDTVPYDQGKWHHDPFTVVEEDGKLYGLGTSDMKAFLAIAVDVAREVDPAKLRRPLIILATADEESTMNGAQALAHLGRPRARYAIIGEPTGLAPVRMHKGVAMEAIRLIGRAGHSSDPSLGINAIDGMHTVIGELMDWRRELGERYRNPAFAVPVPTLNLGHIHGGDNPNRICGLCELHFDMRLMPSMEMTPLREELRQRLGGRLHDTGLHLEMRNLDVEVPAFETRGDSPLVAAAEAFTGQPARSVAFGTEAPFLQKLGIETIVLGPGDIEQAHQPDEYLRVDRIEPMRKILRQMIERFCLQ